MVTHVRLLAQLAVIAALVTAVNRARGEGPESSIQPVGAESVRLTDGFWHSRLMVNRTVTIPALLQQLADTGRIANFERAAGTLRGQPAADSKPPPNPFEDADVYKVIEAAACSLMDTRDAALEARLDVLIDTISAAQEKDGYLYTARTINPDAPPPAVGTERWAAERIDSYELYDLGCLMQAGAAYHRATGNRKLLQTAIRAADLLDASFGPGKKSIWPGHPGVEMGLVALYRATGDARYWKLAKFMLDERGPAAPTSTRAGATAPSRGRGAAGRGPTYNQSQAKFVDQTAATGHAAGAMALFAGAADVAALSTDASLNQALDKIWENMVGTKLYLTGGVGAINDGTFGRNFALNSVNAFDQTDAAAGNILWNQRMFLLQGDARYVDVLERTLYNALLAGISLEGRQYFDANPLEASTIQRPPRMRRESFNGAYSPIRAATVIAAVPGFLYAVGNAGVYVNLFVPGTAQIKLSDGKTIAITQETRYPWDGAVKFIISPGQGGKVPVNIRVPGWAQGKVVPAALYEFAPATEMGDSEIVELKVNRQPIALKPLRGYVTIDREWTAGDTIELTLPMRPRRVTASDQVLDARNRAAIERGPLVYCAEAPDNPNHKVRNIVLPLDSRLTAEFKRDLLGGIAVISGSGFGLSLDDNDKPVRTTQPFLAIPYYAWANRGSASGDMTVWLATADNAAVATSAPSLIATAKLSASPHPDGSVTNPAAVRDGIEPRASSDNSPLSHFDWWPATNGANEWVQADWAEPITLSSTSVYWWDDTGVGECRPPVSWRALYRDGDQWKPVETQNSFGLDKDKYNQVQFTPVKTTGLRLEMVMPNSPAGQRLSVGIQEWKIR